MMKRVCCVCLAMAAIACGHLDMDGVSPYDLDRLLSASRWQLAGHFATTALDADGSLRLSSDIPSRHTECVTRYGTVCRGVGYECDEPLCQDEDGDGLTDEWERLAYARLRPFVRLHADEPLFTDYPASIASVARVAPDPDAYTIFVAIVLAYWKDYGSCTFTDHWGDSERVALRLREDTSEDGSYVVVDAYTAAHEGTDVDGSQHFTGEALNELKYVDDPKTNQPRWLVVSSKGKHATYGSRSMCKNHSDVPCVDETCPDTSGVDALLHTINAGEPSQIEHRDLEGQTFGDLLIPIGLSLDVFTGEYAWSGDDFCGGFPDGKSGCASPLRDKLLTVPF
ncbi:hypothetical protein ACFL6C_07820 [Myxococcota bacterium]